MNEPYSKKKFLKLDVTIIFAERFVIMMYWCWSVFIKLASSSFHTRSGKNVKDKLGSKQFMKMAWNISFNIMKLSYNQERRHWKHFVNFIIGFILFTLILASYLLCTEEFWCHLADKYHWILLVPEIDKMKQCIKCSVLIRSTRKHPHLFQLHKNAEQKKETYVKTIFALSKLRYIRLEVWKQVAETSLGFFKRSTMESSKHWAW